MSWSKKETEQSLADALVPAFLSEETKPELTEKFADHAIRVLARLATAGNILTWRKYELVQQGLDDVLKEKANEPKVRAKLLYALVFPSGNRDEPLEALLDRLSQAAEIERVTFEQKKSLVDSVMRIAKESRQLDDSLSGSCQALAVALQVPVPGMVPTLVGRQSGGAESSIWGYVRRLPTLGSSREIPVLRSSTASLNAKVESSVHNLRQIAWTMNDTELESRISEFEALLEDQPFKIVFVGEAKLGKSSLINALVGEELSPVQETRPETGTIVEFRYGHSPHYRGEWLSKKHLDWLEAFLAKRQDSLLLQDKIERVKSARRANLFVPGEAITEIRSKDDLPDYISAAGRWTNLVRRVAIAWPIECLKSGAVIVDTPGLNAIDRFHEYLALVESHSADCIVFVTEANREPSESERRLLRGLVKSGRTCNIIGVITRVDQVREERTLPLLIEKVQNFLHEVCRGNASITIRGVVPINARQAMEERLSSSPLVRGEASAFGALQHYINLVLVDDGNKKAYRDRLAEQHAELQSYAESRCGEFREKCVAALPSKSVRQAYCRYSESFNRIARFLKESVNKKLQAAEVELKRFCEEANNDCEQTRKLLQKEFLEELQANINRLDKDFLDPKHREEFNRLIAPSIADQHLKGLDGRQRASVDGWTDKLRLYQQDLDALRIETFQQITTQGANWERVSPQNTAFSNWLVHFNQQVKKIENPALWGGAGYLAGKGPGGVLGWALRSVIMSHGWAILGLAGIAGLGWIILGKFGDLDKQKKAYLEKTQKTLEENLEKEFGPRKSNIDQVVRKLAEYYCQVTTDYCRPSYELAAYSALVASLEVEVLDRIERDAEKFEGFMKYELERIAPLRTV